MFELNYYNLIIGGQMESNFHDFTMESPQVNLNYSDLFKFVLYLINNIFYQKDLLFAAFDE
jgi:hypothetical protein